MNDQTAGLLRSMRTNLILINAVLFVVLAYMAFATKPPQSTICLVLLIAQAVGVVLVLRYINITLQRFEQSKAEELSTEDTKA